jgi:hypothetical protein
MRDKGTMNKVLINRSSLFANAEMTPVTANAFFRSTPDAPSNSPSNSPISTPRVSPRGDNGSRRSVTFEFQNRALSENDLGDLAVKLNEVQKEERRSIRSNR